MGRNVFSVYPWVDINKQNDAGWARCLTNLGRDENNRPVESMGFISGQYFPTEDRWLTNLGFEKGIYDAAKENNQQEMENFTLKHTDTISRKEFLVPVLIREAIELADIIKSAQSVLVDASVDRAPNGSVQVANTLRPEEAFGEMTLLQWLITAMEDGGENLSQSEQELIAETTEYEGNEVQREMAKLGMLRLPTGRQYGNASGMSYRDAAKRLKLSYPRVLNFDPMFEYLGRGEDLAIVGRNMMAQLGKYFGKAIPSANGRIDASQYRPLSKITGAANDSPLKQFNVPDPARDGFEGNRDGQVRFKYFDDESYANIKRFIDKSHADYIADLLAEEEPTLAQAQEAIQKPAAKFTTAVTSAPKGGDPENAARVRILNGQKILMRHMSDLININSLTRTEELGGEGSGEKSVAQRRKIVECQSLINYYGKPESLLNLINNPFSGLEDYINANTAELSTLVPQMTFFLTNDKGYRRKIEFPDHVHEYQIKKLAKGRASTDIDKMLRARSNHGTDAGVKSFTWDYDAKDYGQYVIKANLAIFFGSALDLLNDDYRAFLDTTGQPTLGSPVINKRGKFIKISEADKKKKVAKILKIRQAKCQKENPPKETQGGKIDHNSVRQTNFLVPGAQRLHLAVRVGWAYPEGKMPRGVSKTFREAIRKTQREIRLELSGYDVDYSQNGQLTLNLSYSGFIDNATDHIVKADILAGHSDIDEEAVPLSKFVTPLPENDADPEISRTNAITYAKAAWPKGYIVRKAIKNFVPGGKYAMSDLNETVDLAKSGVEYELRTLRMAIRAYQENISKLSYAKKYETIATDASTGETMNLIQMVDLWKGYEKAAAIALDNINETIREPKYAALLNNLLLDKKIYYARLRSETTALNASAYSQKPLADSGLVGPAVANYSVNFAATQPKGKKESLAERKKRIKAALAKASAGQSPAALLDPKVVSTRDFDLAHGTRNLYYIRLGDLVDNILNNLTMSKEDEDYFKVILGSFSPSQIGIPGFRDDQVVMLADIPITLEYFGQFFIKTVVASQRDSMSLKTFLISLMRTLLSPIIREVAKGEGKIAPIFNLTTLFSGVEIDAGTVITQGKLQTVANQREQASMATDKYLVIGVRQITHKDRFGVEEDDLKEGIYHLKLGTDRGIVKSFSFSEMNLTSQYRAMQVLKSANGDGAVIVPQNIELTLYGNQFFPNGTLLYIDADVGFGREISKKLGIGGYYTVIRSLHTITAGKYETKLSCKFESSGNKDG